MNNHLDFLIPAALFCNKKNPASDSAASFLYYPTFSHSFIDAKVRGSTSIQYVAVT